jgi:sulfur carrier protein ThiS
LLADLGIVQRIQLIAVNDEPETDRERILYDGDLIRIFPFVVGG